ncbi:MAG: CPBP family intramembrane metalloprotease [Bdellovibrionales bacterium]|nr:CPBP family intramembrane metalloprotease [Bdellovibrionales bacterium]
MRAKIDSFFPISLIKSADLILFFTITLSMLIIEYFGWQGPFHNLFGPTDWYRTFSQNDRFFYAQIWTTGSFFLFLVIFPTIVFNISFKEMNWMLKKPLTNTAPTYALLYALMLPVLILVATRPQFYQFYPLYRPENAFDWMKFELVYLPQFFAIEYFFRGPSLGLASKIKPEIAPMIMMLPYALIHIHKPFPEAIGSMFAGLVLGNLALKSQSIWLGVLLHMAIALSMDFLGLFNAGFFH